MRERRLVLSGLILLALVAPVGLAWMRVLVDGKETSRIHGTVAAGSVENGHAIPPWGPGFRTYSFLGSALGRQYVDGRVRDTLMAAFAARARAESGRVFVIGETGWPSGGRIRPHRTHQNGSSVDIFVPLVARGSSIPLVNTWPWTKFGYNPEFDQHGARGGDRISFESIAALLLDLDAQARTRGLRLAKIIIAPEYVPLLLDTPSGRKLGPLANLLTRKPAWVRHDEHVHVDFVEG